MNKTIQPQGKRLYTKFIVKRKKFLKSIQQNAIIWSRSDIKTNEFYVSMQVEDGRTAEGEGKTMQEAFMNMIRMFNVKYAA